MWSRVFPLVMFQSIRGKVEADFGVENNISVYRSPPFIRGPVGCQMVQLTGSEIRVVAMRQPLVQDTLPTGWRPGTQITES